jgi:regulatory protein
MDVWEISNEEQNKIIQQLQREKFLDEGRYCRAFINDKSQFNHWGIYKIKFALRKKHLPEDLIKETLQTINPDEHVEQLRQLIEQKKKTVKGKNEFEIRQKLLRFAVGRGYSMAAIEKILG